VHFPRLILLAGPFLLPSDAFSRVNPTQCSIAWTTFQTPKFFACRACSLRRSLEPEAHEECSAAQRFQNHSQHCLPKAWRFCRPCNRVSALRRVNGQHRLRDNSSEELNFPVLRLLRLMLASAVSWQPPCFHRCRVTVGDRGLYCINAVKQ
jgi:hypothetical protein